MSAITGTPTIPRTRFAIFGGMWRVLAPIIRKPAGFIGFFGVLAFLLIAFLGPVLIPAPQSFKGPLLAAPSPDHPLGTDGAGRDVLIMILRGGGDVMIVALTTGILTTLIAVAFGSLAAYLGGLLDRLLNGAANFLLTIPSLVLLSVLSTLVKLNNPLLLAGLLSILGWPSLMRSVRAQVLSLREREYIEAAVTLDLGTRHIILYEILPNMASYIIINFIFAVTSAIYSMVALIFLGFVTLNVQTLNWGLIITNARTAQAAYNPNTQLWLIAPVLTIGILQWLLITLARSIEDTFNPRLKSGA